MGGCGGGGGGGWWWWRESCEGGKTGRGYVEVATFIPTPDFKVVVSWDEGDTGKGVGGEAELLGVGGGGGGGGRGGGEGGGGVEVGGRGEGGLLFLLREEDVFCGGFCVGTFLFGSSWMGCFLFFTAKKHGEGIKKRCSGKRRLVNILFLECTTLNCMK